MERNIKTHEEEEKERSRRSKQVMMEVITGEQLLHKQSSKR